MSKPDSIDFHKSLMKVVNDVEMHTWRLSITHFRLKSPFVSEMRAADRPD
jgi:hypothetical protein